MVCLPVWIFLRYCGNWISWAEVTPPAISCGSLLPADKSVLHSALEEYPGKLHILGAVLSIILAYFSVSRFRQIRPCILKIRKITLQYFLIPHRLAVSHNLKVSLSSWQRHASLNILELLPFHSQSL